MKKYTFLIIFFTFMYSSVANTIDLTQQEKNYIKENSTVKVAMLPHMYPFSFMKNGELQGFSYDLISLLGQISGLTIEFEIDNWPSNMTKFKNKQVDMIDYISYKDSRKAFTLFTNPYYEIPLVLFVHKNFKNYDGFYSLKGKRIGLTKSAFYNSEIKNLGLFDVVEFDNNEDKMLALEKQKIDAVFGSYSYLSGQKRLIQNAYPNITIIEQIELPNIKREDLRLGIIKENRLLYSIIVKSMASITPLQWNQLSTKWLGDYPKYLIEHNKQSLQLTKEEITFLKNTPIRCALTRSWEPFYFKDKDVLQGIAIDYWELITKRANINSHCINLDQFTDVLNHIKRKEADVTISTSITQERLNYAIFSESYLTYPIAIVTTKDKRFVSATSFLNNKKVAVGKGYSSYELLKSKYPTINFIQVKDTNTALQMVSKGHAYAAVDITPVLSHAISKHGFTNLKIGGITEFNFNLRVMIRDDYEPLLSTVNKAIKSISQEDKNKINTKWAPIQYEHYFDYSLLVYTLIFILILACFIVYKQHLLKKYNQQLQDQVKKEVQNNRMKDRQMLHHSKLAQMGEMIAMIAHQWRQPLNAISATIINLQTHIELNKFDLTSIAGRNEFKKFSRNEFDNIDLYIQSLSQTLEDFINFYRPNKKREPLLLKKPIQTALTIVKASLQNTNIKIIENYQSQLTINISHNELVQVLLNLIKNSQDSFIEHDITNPTITINVEDVSNGVVVEFKDNGSGIDESIIDKIFDPYFSTKEEGKGTGLGLYMSKIIIEDHHEGKFSIKSYEKGTGFTIFLPKETPSS